MPATDADYEAMMTALREACRVVLTTHVRPDGDALGTTAAMALGLSRLGIDAECLVLSEVPPKYAFLYADARVQWRYLKDVDATAMLDGADALLVCDTGTWSQLPGLQEPIEVFGGKKLVLDHHVTQEDWADVKLVDTTAGAAAEVALLLLKRLGIPLDRKLAEPLYAAMATDTGWFAYSNTSPRTLRLAADCVEAGADPDALNGRLYRSERAERIRLFARGLSSLELLEDGRLAVMTLAKADYDAAGATVTDGEDLINEPMKIATVEASLLIGENPQADAVAERAVKVSLRSKGQLDCAAFLRQFGGGGHPRAAGARVEGTLAEAKTRVATGLIQTLRP